MSADEIRQRTQIVGPFLQASANLAAVVVCAIAEGAPCVRVDLEALPSDTPIRDCDRQRASGQSAKQARWLARQIRRLFVTTPMPDLQVPRSRERKRKDVRLALVGLSFSLFLPFRGAQEPASRAVLDRFLAAPDSSLVRYNALRRLTATSRGGKMRRR
jgi:hypothetical protein